MKIGKNIKRIRKEKGLTQKALGELCGINEANIRKYENDKQNPKLETALKIAKALNVSVWDLLGANDEINYTVTFPNEYIKKIGNSYLSALFNESEPTTITPTQLGRILINELTDEELKEVIQFIEFLKSKRK